MPNQHLQEYEMAARQSAPHAHVQQPGPSKRTTTDAVESTPEVAHHENAPAPEFEGNNHEIHDGLNDNGSSNSPTMGSGGVSDASDETILPLYIRDLGVWDVATLNLNKMIGTGIFTTPGLVLKLVGHQGLSVGFWALGGVYALICVCVYTEYGIHIPFNGGEFIYLDRVVKRPRLFVTTTAGAFFILIATTTGNCLAFAKHIALITEPRVLRTEDLSRPLITYIAVSVLTAVCVLHFFSRKMGLFMNRLFAYYKIALLTAFALGGFITAGRYEGKGLLTQEGWHKNQKPDVKDIISASIYILYSYQGWENANYVAGEIDILVRPKRKALMKGSFISVIIVTVLYISVTLSYGLICKYEELAGKDLPIVAHFVPKVFKFRGAPALMKLAIALSAFGNLIAVVYTYSRVKQQVAKQQLFPMPKWFGEMHTYYKTPVGGLILHWIVTTLMIAVTPNTSNGYGFTTNFFSYGHLFLGCCLGFVLPYLRRDMIAKAAAIQALYHESPHEHNPSPYVSAGWEPIILKNSLLLYGIGGFFSIFSAFMLVGATLGTGQPPRWLWPIVIGGVLGLAIVYWGILRWWLSITKKYAVGGERLWWETYNKIWLYTREDIEQITEERNRKALEQRLTEVEQLGGYDAIIVYEWSDSGIFTRYVRKTYRYFGKLLRKWTSS